MLLTDSMAKRLKTSPDSTLAALPGATAVALLDRLADSPEMVHHFKVIVPYVGTNEFGSKPEWNYFQVSDQAH